MKTVLHKILAVSLVPEQLLASKEGLSFIEVVNNKLNSSVLSFHYLSLPFSTLCPKYSAQHPVLKHPQLVLTLGWESRFHTRTKHEVYLLIQTPRSRSLLTEVSGWSVCVLLGRPIACLCRYIPRISGSQPLASSWGELDSWHTRNVGHEFHWLWRLSNKFFCHSENISITENMISSSRYNVRRSRSARMFNDIGPPKTKMCTVHFF